MDRKSNEEIITILQETLPEKRYLHSLRVADCAVRLSEIYDCDTEKAYLAGITHDIAKYTKPDVIKKYVEEYHIDLDIYEEKSLALSHSVLGSYVAKFQLGIDDEDVLSAIRYHTTGKPDMNMMEKIIFVADLIEESRDFDGVDEVRTLAYGGELEMAIIKSIENTIKHVIRKGQTIHPRSVEARNFIITSMKNGIEAARNMYKK